MELPHCKNCPAFFAISAGVFLMARTNGCEMYLHIQLHVHVLASYSIYPHTKLRPYNHKQPFVDKGNNYCTLDSIVCCCPLPCRSLMNESFLPLGKWFARSDPSVAPDGRYALHRIRGACKSKTSARV